MQNSKQTQSSVTEFMSRPGLTSINILYCGAECAHELNYRSSSVKHGEGTIMVWAYMASSTGSLIFTGDKSSEFKGLQEHFVY